MKIHKNPSVNTEAIQFVLEVLLSLQRYVDLTNEKQNLTLTTRIFHCLASLNKFEKLHASASLEGL